MRTILSLFSLLLPISAMAPAAQAAEPDCRYDVLLRADMHLVTEVRCRPEVDGFTVVNAATDLYMTYDLEEHAEVTVGRYDIDLAAFVRGENSADSAAGTARSVLATGGSWLLRPLGIGDAELAVTLRAEPGVAIATGLRKVDGAHRLRSSDLPYAGFTAFGRFERRLIREKRTGGGEGTIESVILEGDLAVGRDVLNAWIDDSLRAGLEFWRGLPAENLLLAILPRPHRGGVPFGRVMSGGGVTMVVYVGGGADQKALDDDWVFLHEMIHIGTPFSRTGMWFAEGQATYFEPLIRVRWGRQTEQQMWQEFVTRMPRSARLIEASGLANSGWGDMYYGGAILMLLADVEARRLSGGRTGLEDCFRGLQLEEGNASRRIRLHALIAACDKVLGAPIMRRVTDRYAFAANDPALDALWRKLGVVWNGVTVTLNDDAEWAWIRRALIRGASEG